jgi:hypothetical protein
MLKMAKPREPWNIRPAKKRASVPASIKNSMYDVITRHFNGELDDKKATAALAAAAKQ